MALILELGMLVVLPQAAGGCATCHAAQQAAEAVGIHAKSASCVDCHGGRPREAQKEAAHAGFTGKIDRRAVPELCAKCHADVRRMNPYGLPTDQLSQYRASKHGEALQQGKPRAAVCSDCHGVHGMRPSRDPLSPVSPARVPATCGTCHGDRALMEPMGRSWDAEAKFREGAHGKLLLEKGDASAPHCATCHGSHGASPPGFATVGQVCGKCHGRQLEHFEASPHAFYAKDGSFKGCPSCHSNHRIVTAPAEIAGRCGPCHEPAEKEVKSFEALSLLLSDARSAFGQTSGRLAAATRAGRHTDDEKVLLDRARTSLLELQPLQHALNATKVAQTASTARAVLGEIEGRLDRGERELRLRKLALAPIGIFLAAMAALFVAAGRRAERARGGGHVG